MSRSQMSLSGELAGNFSQTLPDLGDCSLHPDFPRPKGTVLGMKHRTRVSACKGDRDLLALLVTRYLVADAEDVPRLVHHPCRVQ